MPHDQQSACPLNNSEPTDSYVIFTANGACMKVLGVVIFNQLFQSDGEPFLLTLDRFILGQI